MLRFLFLVAFVSGCASTPQTIPTVIVSDGVWTYDSEKGTVTQHNCFKPEETVEAQLNDDEILDIVEQARGAGFFRYSGKVEHVSPPWLEDGFRRICVTSYFPPHRLMIEIDGQVVDVSWNSCVGDSSDTIGILMRDLPPKVLMSMDVVDEFGEYDCTYR